jgi:hypothetical protein
MIGGRFLKTLRIIGSNDANPDSIHENRIGTVFDPLKIINSRLMQFE